MRLFRQDVVVQPVCRLVACLIAVGVVALNLALPAHADEIADQQFMSRVSPLGYGQNPSRAISTAHFACSLLRSGAGSRAAEDYAITALGDSREGAGYFAALFVQAAVNSYCPT
jgi:hypothetical protein